MSNFLPDLQRAAGVTHIFWIDDMFFGEPQEDKLKATIHATIVRLFSAGKQPKHGQLKDVDPKAPDPVRRRQVQSVLDDPSTRLPGMLDCLIKQEMSDNDGIIDSHDDLNPAQVIVMKEALQGATMLSHTDWNTQADAIIGGANKSSLFLIDREFDKEGLGSEAGDDLVKAITDRAPDAFCIMLTHKVGHDGIDDLRRAISIKMNVPLYRFSLISKRDIGSVSTEANSHFARALRETMLQRFCIDVAKRIRDVVTVNPSKFIDDLSSLTVDEVDNAIFESSLHEGASEIGVVTRIFFLQQRIAVQEGIAASPGGYVELLSRIRRVREVRVPVPDGTTANVTGTLQAWRKAEVFEPAALINPINSPLSCGDVFVHSQKGRQYVLLAQPCDIIIRGGGTTPGERNRNEAIFAEIKIEDRDIENRDRYFVIEGIEGGRHWAIDLKDAFAVSLRLLDLAVMNPHGNVEWTQGQDMPETLLPGWKMRFSQLVETFRVGSVPSEFRSPCICNHDFDLLEIGPAGTFKWPLSRIGRVCTPYAQAILGSFASFISRTAFDHDFARCIQSRVFG